MKKANFKEAMELWAKPERVVLVTSMDDPDKPRVMTVGWITRASFLPPTLAIAIGKDRAMHRTINDSRQFVVAVPGENLADETLLCGTPAAPDVDRFAQCKFKTKPASLVQAPLIENCTANFECKVIQQADSGDHTLFIGEVVASWINEQPGQNLLLIGHESGYQLLREEGPYRIGIVREEK